jgi:hypothetical protein
MTVLALTLVLVAALGLVLRSGGTGRGANRRWRGVLVAAAMATVLPTVVGSPAEAEIVPAVPMGTAADYSVLGGSTVTNTGASLAVQNLGVSPGSSVTGFPPGVVSPGTIHPADAPALVAQNDLTIAYNNAALRTPSPVTTPTPVDLGGLTLVGGVYNSGGAVQLTGNLTLDGANDPHSVFIFQSASTLTTASNATVTLVNGAQECNVFWQVGSSATLGTGTAFAGNILALASVTLTTGVDLNGRALARSGAVTMDTNQIDAPTCVIPPPPTTTTTATTAMTATTTPAPGGGGEGEGVGVQQQQQATTTRSTSTTRRATTTTRTPTTQGSSNPSGLPATGSASGYELALAALALLIGTGAIALGRARDRRSTG